MQKTKYALIGLVLFVCAASAGAAINTIVADPGTVAYSNRADWEAAAGSTMTLDFEGIASPSTGWAYVKGETFSGVTVSSAINYLYVIEPFFGPTWYDWGSGATLSASKGSDILLTFEPGIRAVGFDVMTFDDYARIVYIGADSGYWYMDTDDYPQRTFFGFTSTTDILGMALTTNNSRIAIDNLSFNAAASEVPEPASMVLMTVGLLAFGAQRMRRC